MVAEVVVKVNDDVEAADEPAPNENPVESEALVVVAGALNIPKPPLGAASPDGVVLADGAPNPRGFGVPEVSEKDGNVEAVVEEAAVAPPNENPVLLDAAGAAVPNATP